MAKIESGIWAFPSLVALIRLVGGDDGKVPVTVVGVSVRLTGNYPGNYPLFLGAKKHRVFTFVRLRDRSGQ